MNRIVTILILLSLFACKKDEETELNGTYTVTTDDNKGHHFPGTVSINGTNITLTGVAWGNRTGTITPDGDNFVINYGAQLRTGSGQVRGNQITGVVQIYYPGGIDTFDFEGEK